MRKLERRYGNRVRTGWSGQSYENETWNVGVHTLGDDPHALQATVRLWRKKRVRTRMNASAGASSVKTESTQATRGRARRASEGDGGRRESWWNDWSSNYLSR